MSNVRDRNNCRLLNSVDNLNDVASRLMIRGAEIVSMSAQVDKRPVIWIKPDGKNAGLPDVDVVRRPGGVQSHFRTMCSVMRGVCVMWHENEEGQRHG